MDRQTDDEIRSQVWGTVTHPLERQRWKGHSKFTVILVVTVSSRPSGLQRQTLPKLNQVTRSSSLVTYCLVRAMWHLVKLGHEGNSLITH